LDVKRVLQEMNKQRAEVVSGAGSS
jgi:hypothetical protein